MFRVFAAVIFLFSFTCLSITPPAYGQTDAAKREKKAKSVKDQIGRLGTGESAKVRVKTYSGISYEGFVASVNADGFGLTDKMGTNHVIDYADVKSIGGKNLSTGEKIAIGIGIGIGATILTLYLIWVGMD